MVPVDLIQNSWIQTLKTASQSIDWRHKRALSIRHRHRTRMWPFSIDVQHLCECVGGCFQQFWTRDCCFAPKARPRLWKSGMHTRVKEYMDMKGRGYAFPLLSPGNWRSGSLVCSKHLTSLDSMSLGQMIGTGKKHDVLELAEPQPSLDPYGCLWTYVTET